MRGVGVILFYASTPRYEAFRMERIVGRNENGPTDVSVPFRNGWCGLAMNAGSKNDIAV